MTTTQTVKKEVNKLKQEIIPSFKKGIAVRDQNGVYHYNNKAYKTKDELQKDTEDMKLIIVKMWRPQT